MRYYKVIHFIYNYFLVGDSNAPFIIKFIFGKFSHRTEYTSLTENKSSINFEEVKKMVKLLINNISINISDNF